MSAIGNENHLQLIFGNSDNLHLNRKQEEKKLRHRIKQKLEANKQEQRQKQQQKRILSSPIATTPTNLKK